MILIGLGANLPHGAQSPRETLERALEAFPAQRMAVTACSRWYRSRAVGVSGPAPEEPDYVNGVAAIRSALSPEGVLSGLRAIEDRFGRVREKRWESRTLDLDLLDYEGRRMGRGPGGQGGPGGPEGGRGGPNLILPHPEVENRAFVLVPLAEVAPDWRHPVSGLTVSALISALPESATGSMGLFEELGRER